MKYRKNFFFLFSALVYLFIIYFSSTSLYSAASRWGLSGGIEIPYPWVESGFSYSLEGDTKSFNYNKTLGRFAEISVIKSSNPEFLNDKIRINAKLKIMETVALFPGICVGVYNLNMDKKDRIFFLSAQSSIWNSGTFFSLGVTRDDTGVTTPFYGIEQSFFSFISLILEKFRQKINVGLRIKPLPGLNLDVYVHDWDSGNRDLYYNISLMVRY